jgi:hypothetical protein
MRLKALLATAGHCPGTLTYNNVSLPVQGQRWETRYDYQWHTAPGFDRLTNVIYEGLGSLLPITAEYDYSWMQWGDWVCKCGSATGWTCGGISNLDYSALGYGGFVEVHQPEGTNLSNPGDSGAPWYNPFLRSKEPARVVIGSRLSKGKTVTVYNFPAPPEPLGF